MFPIWIAIAFLSFVTLFFAVDLPKQKAAQTAVQVNHDVTSMLAYRKAVISYLAANPSATGTITSAALASYWPLGYTNTGARWSNYVDPGTAKLYIFSLSAANNEILSRLHTLYGDSFFIGTQDSSGNFISFNGLVNTPAPPAAGIVNGAVIIIGR